MREYTRRWHNLYQRREGWKGENESAEIAKSCEEESNTKKMSKEDQHRNIQNDLFRPYLDLA